MSHVERGRMGGRATAEKHPDRGYTQKAREAFLAKFPTPESREAHFRALAVASAAARRSQPRHACPDCGAEHRVR